MLCRYCSSWSNLKQKQKQKTTTINYIFFLFCFLFCLKDVALVEFMQLVFTRMPGESYRSRLMSLLLYLCYAFRALINSLVSWFARALSASFCFIFLTTGKVKRQREDHPRRLYRLTVSKCFIRLCTAHRFGSKDNVFVLCGKAV